MDKLPDKLINTSTDRTDYTVSGLKGLVSLIPIAGSLIAEVIGVLIPNQRIDRIDKYLHILDDKVKAIERENLETKIRDPRFIDLFEDSLHQVIRALSQERIEYIASVVKNNLSDEQVDYARDKLILMLLSELNDVEVLILKHYSLLPPQSEQFWEQHKDILSAPIAVQDSTQEQIDKSVIHTSYKEHLVRLDLLRPRFRKPKKGESPEFDEKTGMIKAHGYQITPLGRLLLRRVDLDENSN